MARTREVEVGITLNVDGEEIDAVATCAVSPGRPGRTYGEPGDCYPPEDPEVEILALRDDARNVELPAALRDLTDAEIDKISDKAVEAAEDDARADYEAAADARIEYEREMRAERFEMAADRERGN